MVAVSLKKIFFQAEDGIRDWSWSRGLGDVYKRQALNKYQISQLCRCTDNKNLILNFDSDNAGILACLLYTSDAADE